MPTAKNKNSPTLVRDVIHIKNKQRVNNEFCKTKEQRIKNALILGPELYWNRKLIKGLIRNSVNSRTNIQLMKFPGGNG